MGEQKESRPDWNEAASAHSAGTHLSLSPEHLALVAGVYVAVVEIRGKHTPARFRRRAYWNLPSAQKAIDRATMDGLDASIILCQLIPVSDTADE